MFEHEENPFEKFAEGETEHINVSLPLGEIFAVNGTRQTPITISINKNTERNPKRDARLLATILASSLDEQTTYHLSEMLFAEFLAPMMKETQSLFSAMQNAPQSSPKKPRRSPKKENEDKD